MRLTRIPANPGLREARNGCAHGVHDEVARQQPAQVYARFMDSFGATFKTFEVPAVTSSQVRAVFWLPRLDSNQQPSG
jgi:hypothetical protein